MEWTHSGRRRFLCTSGSWLAGSVFDHCFTGGSCAQGQVPSESRGAVVGHAAAAQVGNSVLSSGGNAVDAAVAAALFAGVVALPSTGIGGYGGVAVVGGLPEGRIDVVDFTGTAPARLKADSYESMGGAGGPAHAAGWTSVGVPGVLAGLQTLIDRYGSRSLKQLAEPAIEIARNGFPLDSSLAKSIASYAEKFRRDAGCTRLFLPAGVPLAAGQVFRNPQLADMLDRLAQAGRVDDFYKGSIARDIAMQCHRGGGWLTTEDLSAFEPEVTRPLSVAVGEWTIHTAPPPAGGLTVLQILLALHALGWPDEVPAARRDVAFLEAMRVAWHDRLALLGDPRSVPVPIERLLSIEHARAAASRIRTALEAGSPLPGQSDGLGAKGTIHLNAIDANGLSVALTFTHGDGFGAQVAVDGLGLLLGHGLSRFDPRSGRANSPGPGKRPLHNMCPMVVTRQGKVDCVLGATGGRRIVSAVACVLSNYLFQQSRLPESVSKGRWHTEGGLEVTAEPNCPAPDPLLRFGYKVQRGSVASLTALQRMPDGRIAKAPHASRGR